MAKAVYIKGRTVCVENRSVRVGTANTDCCQPVLDQGCNTCCPPDPPGQTRFPEPCTPGVPPWIEIYTDRRIQFDINVLGECVMRPQPGDPLPVGGFNPRLFNVFSGILQGQRYDRIDQPAPGIGAVENRCVVTCERPVDPSDPRYIAPGEPGYPGEPGVTQDYMDKPQTVETLTVGDITPRCWEQTYDLAYTTRFEKTIRMRVFWNSCARYHDIWGRLLLKSEGGQRMNALIDMRVRILAGFLPGPVQPPGGPGGEQRGAEAANQFQVLIGTDLTFEAGGPGGGIGQISGGFSTGQVTRSTFTGGCQSRGGVSLFKPFGDPGGFHFFDGTAHLTMLARLAVDWNYDTAGYVNCSAARGGGAADAASGIEPVVRTVTLAELESLTRRKLWGPDTGIRVPAEAGGCAGCGQSGGSAGVMI